MPRRTYGSGSITVRSDGRFQASFELPRGADGKRRRRTLYGKTEAEVKRKLAAAQREAQRAPRTEPSQQTVKDFLEQWLRDVIVPRGVPNTTHAYQTAINRVVPLLGHLPLSGLTPQDCQRWYAQLAPLYAPTTLKLNLGVLRLALAHAVRWGLIERNPAEVVTTAKLEPRESPALTRAQCQALVTALRGHPDEALWLVALAGGLRIGELLGLRWQDVDLTRGLVHVRQQVQRAAQGGRETRRPKTRKSTRVVPIGALAVHALRRHRQAQAEARLRFGPGYQDYDLIWPRADGRPAYDGTYRERWYKLLHQAGLPRFTPHATRHTWTSLALELGAAVPEVSARLGHANASITLSRYSHFLGQAQDRGLADRIDAAIRPED